MEFLNDVFPALAALIGFPALLAAGINMAKQFGLPDGYAPKVVLYGNLAMFVFVLYLSFAGKLSILSAIDSQLGTLAAFLVTFSAFVADIGLTKLFHAGLRGVPLIGYSYSHKK
jgi:hypothetical protein